MSTALQKDPVISAPGPPSGSAEVTSHHRLYLVRRLVALLLVLSGILTTGYAGISTYAASKLIYETPKSITRTPATLGLDFRPVTFESRGDRVRLQGWFIPGLLPGNIETAERTIIVVHGVRTNREDKDAGVLDVSAQLARHGFAVLAFDMRGMGQSTAAPLSMGIYEQRDVLGAVDFLRTGPLPHPDLGRPKIIAGWGVSMGASTLLMAASQEPAIRAVVADCPYADAAPLLQREIPKKGGLPAAFTPGVFVAARILFDVDFYSARPVDVVSDLAPRPVFFIHGLEDTYVPPSNTVQLVAAARMPGSHVQVWYVPAATHAQSFHVAGQEYVRRVIGFFEGALGPATGRGQV